VAQALAILVPELPAEQLEALHTGSSRHSFENELSEMVCEGSPPSMVMAVVFVFTFRFFVLCEGNHGVHRHRSLPKSIAMF